MLIKDVIKKWYMEGLAERIKIKLTFLCIHLSYLLCCFDSWVSDDCLKLLKIARIVLFIFFPTLNWYYLTKNLYFHLLLYLSLLAWINFGFENCWYKQSHIGVVYLFKLQENVACNTWLNLSANTYKTLYIIENFICLFYDSMYIGFYALYRFVTI